MVGTLRRVPQQGLCTSVFYCLPRPISRRWGCFMQMSFLSLFLLSTQGPILRFTHSSDCTRTLVDGLISTMGGRSPPITTLQVRSSLYRHICLILGVQKAHSGAVRGLHSPHLPASPVMHRWPHCAPALPSRLQQLSGAESGRPGGIC